MRNEIVYDFVWDFLHISFELFLRTQIIHCPLVRSSQKVVPCPVFTHLKVLKERYTVQIVDGKVKAIDFGLILVSFFKGSACLHSSVQMSSAYRE